MAENNVKKKEQKKKEDYTPEQWAEIIRYRNQKKSTNYKAYHIHLNKELDKKYIDILDSVPKGEMPNYIRELIENDVKRTDGVAQRYLRKNKSDTEAAEYYRQHRDPFENHVPLARVYSSYLSFQPDKHHEFTNRMFIECKRASQSDVKFDERRTPPKRRKDQNDK